VKRAALFMVALAFVLGVAACGGGEETTATPETVEGTLPQETGGGATAEGDAAKGKAVFASAGCGGCHTFEPAGSNGSVGPNLDDANVSMDAAVAQIENGGGGMPPFKDRLSEQEIADVAAFVTQQ
jgi:mono/diheme cytochrome c family protein